MWKTLCKVLLNVQGMLYLILQIFRICIILSNPGHIRHHGSKTNITRLLVSGNKVDFFRYSFISAKKLSLNTKEIFVKRRKARLTLKERDLERSEYLTGYFNPRGYFQIRRSGGLDLTSSLEAKFGARSGQVHQIRGKIWEVLSPQDAKEESQFWGHI